MTVRTLKLSSKIITDGGIFDIITFEEATLLIKEILKKKNMKQFCADNSLCYNNVIAIKNGRAKNYPDLTLKLIRILYDIDIEEIKVYKLITKKNEP